RDRSERCGRQQLWIIPASGAFISVCPPVIEYVLTVGMSFCIKGHHPVNCTVWAGDREVLRRPARARRRRTALLERVQEGMGDARVAVPSTPIPGDSRYLGDCRMDFNRNCSAAIVHR